MKKKTGRPSKYRQELPQLVKEYGEMCERENKYPKVYEFCRINGVNVQKVDDYSKLNKSFRLAIENLKKQAESFLLDNALSRKVDPGFAKFILAANYGYVETSKQIQEGKIEPVVINVDMGNGYKPPTSTLTSPKETTEPS